MSSKRLVAAAGAAVVLAALLAGCGSKHPSAATTSTTTSNGCTVVSDPPAQPAAHLKAPTAMLATGKTYDVTLQTNCGSITFELDQAESPHACASFVALVKRGYFNATIFHRIAVGFVIQGGDPTQSGNGGPGYTTIDTPPANATYPLGTVAMAKTQLQPRGAAGSQFFITTTTAAASELTPDYAIIGKVTKGLAVVERIGKLGNVNEQPTMVVEILKATVGES